MKLYQLYTTDSDSLYKEYATDFITTLEKLDFLLTDDNFLTEVDVYIQKGITGRVVKEPNNYGVINIKIQYLDWFEDYEEVIFSLVPLKHFM